MYTTKAKVNYPVSFRRQASLHSSILAQCHLTHLLLYILLAIPVSNVTFRLLGMRLANVYDVDHKTYLLKLARWG